MTNKENGIDFNDPSRSVVGFDEYQGEIVASDWIVLEGVKGVRYRTWKYKDVDEAIVDGALVEIQPGCRTPVQYVETDHVFQENFQKGKFLIFHIDKDGLSVYKFDSSIEEVSFSLEVKKGEAMCIYALKENDQPCEVVECEKPGFSTAKLISVSKDSEKVGDLEIPASFWKIIKMLGEGIESDLPVAILDVGEEMGETIERNGSIVDLADIDIVKISSLLPETSFEVFLDSYEEAQKIAKELIGAKKSVERKELERKVVEKIKDKASQVEIGLEGIDASLAEGTLNQDFPNCKDFIDFVVLAVEEAGGVINEK